MNELSKTFTWAMAKSDSQRAYKARGQGKQRIIRNGAEKAYAHTANKITSILLMVGFFGLTSMSVV